MLALRLAALLNDDMDLLATLVQVEMARSLRDRVPIPVLRFDVRTAGDPWCKEHLRFTVDEVLTIHRLLRLPEIIHTAQRVPILSLEAFCILLKRLAYPCRWKDLVDVFGRSTSALCSAFLIILRTIHQKVHDRLQFDHAMIDRFKDTSADAIYQKTRSIRGCIGFIDGTVRPIARPSYFQRIAYCGHKRVHAIKFQSVILANGLIVSMTGPMEGRHHDIVLLRTSGLGVRMKNNFSGYTLYGDPAYPINTWILRPFRGKRLTQPQKDFNKAMSGSRVAVEHVFKDVVTPWAFLDFRKNLKVFLSPVAKLYLVGSFLTNCKACLHGNQTSKTFDCPLPSIEEYIEGR